MDHLYHKFQDYRKEYYRIDQFENDGYHIHNKAKTFENDEAPCDSFGFAVLDFTSRIKEYKRGKKTFV